MGVPHFFKWLQDNNKYNVSLISSIIEEGIYFLMIDANCLLHPCVANIVEKYKKNEINVNNRNDIEELIWKRIEDYINDLIKRTKPENVFIAVDGVAQRRYKNHNSVTDNEIYPTQTIELTPATKYMERIHKKFINYCKNLKINIIYSSYLEENEGEHKILQYIKNNIEFNKKIVIYGLDADLLFLALTDNMKHDIFIMREKQIFDNKEIDDDIIKNLEYNYVRINELNNIVDLLKENPEIKLEIKAHTDNTGNDSNNFVLSGKRAESIKQHLISKKIEQNRLQTKSVGSKEPKYPNTTEENKRRNRRVEFKIL